MMFQNLATLLNRFKKLGAIQVFAKPLAENDNSKQQIYLGGSLDAAQMFPFKEVDSEAKGRDSTYKAKLDFFWITDDIKEHAPGAQLILYPQYPEVRLSGFLRGCTHGPNEHLRPVPKERRRFNNGHDGRILFLGITASGETLATLAPANSPLADEFRTRCAKEGYRQESVFYILPLEGRDSKEMLLEKLAGIRDSGWQPSIRLNKHGTVVPYKALNGGGYTLEALLGIIPNGRAEPDFMGWEIKAHGGDRITLMTPEPDGGIYGERGVKEFVRKFGKPAGNDVLYFTGTHKSGTKNMSTGLTLTLRGFDPAKQRIEDVDGAIELLTDAGDCAAAWSFSDLMISWNRKHAQAAYVPYESQKVPDPCYRYLSPAQLGEGTDFTRYLSALNAGLVVFDPGSKIMNASTPRSSVKARSQFRIPAKRLSALYKEFGPAEF